MQRDLVVVTNLGTPEAPTPEAVRAFLSEFLSDPLVVDYPRWFWAPILNGIILRSRPRKVAQLYEEIWSKDGSPLEVETIRIRDGLARRLEGTCEVRHAFRYGRRSLEKVLPSWKKEAERIWVVSLFPQRTSSSSGSILEDAKRLALEGGWGERLRLVEIPPDDPGYVAGLAARVREAWPTLGEGGEEPGRELPSRELPRLLLSYHGIPVRYDRNEGGVYQKDCAATTDALLRELDWPQDRATLCFQSKFGPEPWLKPATAELFETLPGQGDRSLLVINPGFLTEGLETLEEIGRTGRASFLAAGGEELIRVGAVVDHPEFLDGLAGRIRVEIER